MYINFALSVINAITARTSLVAEVCNMFTITHLYSIDLYSGILTRVFNTTVHYGKHNIHALVSTSHNKSSYKPDTGFKKIGNTIYHSAKLYQKI